MRGNRTAAAALGAAMMWAVLGACGGGSSDSNTTGPDNSTVQGTYVLKTVDGTTPPGIYHLTASERLMLDSATIRLSANNAYSDIRKTTLFDVTGEHSATDTKTGTWSFADGTVSFSYNNDLGIPSTATATWSSGTMTKTENGVVLVFKKK